MRNLIFCAIFITGCSFPANPHTRVGIYPLSRSIEFYDSKDNDIEVLGLKYDKNTGDFSLEKLTIRNNASDVRTANVKQIEAYTAQVQALAQMTQNLGQIVAAVVPFFKQQQLTNIQTPYGTVTHSTTTQPVQP